MTRRDPPTGSAFVTGFDWVRSRGLLDGLSDTGLELVEYVRMLCLKRLLTGLLLIQWQCTKRGEKGRRVQLFECDQISDRSGTNWLCDLGSAQDCGEFDHEAFVVSRALLLQ